jgi:CHAT domain-containing protein/tetratricopeptide (TPR) repeat protein
VLAVLVTIVAVAVVWFSLDRVGDLLFQRGLRAKHEWQLESATRYFDWARWLQRSPTSATLELGLCQQLGGDFLYSQQLLGRLLESGISDHETLSRIHNAIGVNHYSFAEPDAAIASHELALEHAHLAGNRRLAAEALIGLSRVFYHSKGRYYDALANLEKAHAIGKELPDEGIQAAALRNLGVIYWWFKGELDRPLSEFYFPALELYRRQNDQRGAATMLTLIALVFNNKGDIFQFMRYQNESIEIQKRIGDRAGLADSYMTMGLLYKGVGNYRKAHDFFYQGLKITGRTGYRLAENDLNALLADVQVNLEEYDEALRLYDPQLKHKDPESALSNYVLQYIAHCYQLKGDYEQARTLYERALRAHEQAGLPDVRFRSNTLLRAAECSISLGDWPRASQYWTLAAQEAEKGDVHSEGEIRPALVAAAIAQHEGRHEDALKYLRHALDVEEQILASARTNLLIPPHRHTYDLLYGFLLDYAITSENSHLSQFANEIVFGFLESMRYRSLRNFLVQVKERSSPAPPADEREKALTKRIERLAGELKASGNERTRQLLRNAYHEFEELTLKAQMEQAQYSALNAAKPVTLAELQRSCPVDTALIEFLFVREKVFALVITQSGMRAIRLPASKSALAAKAKLFRSLVFTTESNENLWLPVAESLYTNLFGPLESAGVLKNITTLGFVPYSFLHDLPFAALARRESGEVKFLVLDYALFQTPSATVFANKRQGERSEARSSTTIAFGRNQSNDTSLPNLAFAAEEAEAVALITGGQALVNEKATEADLKRLVSDCDYLHLSTHGVAESELPLFSRVLLEPTNSDDGNLTVREIFELGLQAKLVTLSACETGRSFSLGGNEFTQQDRIGLIEAFLHANSRSVLASLFPINDRTTTGFMKRFYEEIHSNRSKVDALAAAQRAMMRGEISHPPASGTQPASAYTHPRYWAPFILVGDPE